jgi:uncharacterized protein with ATP-grasp and redox domains
VETIPRMVTPDSVPDMLRLVVHTAALASDDVWLQTKILKQALSTIEGADFDRSVAELAFEALSASSKMLGNADPFEYVKAQANQAMLGILPMLRPQGGEEDPILAGVRLSAAATAVDFAQVGDSPSVVRRELEEYLAAGSPLDDSKVLRDALKAAESVLIILDRAGEIVADRILVEALAGREVQCAVQRAPMLARATADDAVAVGLDGLANVIDPGAEMLGLVLSRASKRFMECFAAADVVIAKGSENFQTLAGAEREVFFLLTPRFQADAQYLRIEPTQWAVVHHQPAEVQAKGSSGHSSATRSV